MEDRKREKILERNAYYVKVNEMPWERLRPNGSERKVLYENKETGAATIMFRMPAGGVVPFHEHPELEQTYVLEGSLVDEEGECGPGDFVWRPAGSRHEAHSPNGAVFIAVFQKPSRPL
jgi:quercetin dioxygenase-like cupin family protein